LVSSRSPQEGYFICPGALGSLSALGERSHRRLTRRLIAVGGASYIAVVAAGPRQEATRRLRHTLLIGRVTVVIASAMQFAHRPDVGDSGPGVWPRFFRVPTGSLECFALPKLNGLGVNAGISPIDKSSRVASRTEVFVCSAKEIAAIYRRATEAAKFSEESSNPVERKEFKEIERRWLSLARDCKCNSEEPSKRRTHSPRRKAR
jgi:hypothetical protein